MKFAIPPLPYAKNALEPHMGRETLEFHYEKHHKGYLKKLRGLVEGKPEADRSLEELIRTSDGAVYENAAQVWNHTFFWNGMEPRGGGKPGRELAGRIEADFGSWAAFCAAFRETGTGRFGSGYVWLVLDGARLRCIDSHDAGNPLVEGRTPLLTCDVWEHAYYLDHRNEREKYLRTFLKHLVNWDFVAENLQRAGG